MIYGVLNTGLANLFFEYQSDELFFTDHPNCQVFHSFSAALDNFEKYNTQHYRCYYAKHNNGIITIAAFMLPSLADSKSYEGPFETARIAYGVMHIQALIKSSCISESEQQFGIGSRLIFDYSVECDDRCFCRFRTTDPIQTSINVTPRNSIDHIHSGQQMTLRLLGKADDIYAYPSPVELQKELHIPAKIIIPIGTYHSDISEQDSSIILTGPLSRVFLQYETNIMRYQVTVQTLAMEVDLEIYTHYSLHEGEYVYVSTSLSAVI